MVFLLLFLTPVFAFARTYDNQVRDLIFKDVILACRISSFLYHTTRMIAENKTQEKLPSKIVVVDLSEGYIL